jgi:hypothetical protein
MYKYYSASLNKRAFRDAKLGDCEEFEGVAQLFYAK